MNAIFTYNFVNKTIVGTKSAINRANKGMKPEYDTLCKMLAEHPDFAVAEKQIDHKADKKKYNGLTLPRMKEYIETQPNSEKRLIEFAAIQKVAKAKGALYPLTKKWFLTTFPEFKKNNVSKAEISAEVAVGEDDLAKAAATLAVIENEKKTAYESANCEKNCRAGVFAVHFRSLFRAETAPSTSGSSVMRSLAQP